MDTVPVTLRTFLPALVALGLLATASPALAHPFGPPPTARIAAEGRTVTIDWSATPDDAVAVGEKLGLMPPGSVAAYRQESAAQVAPSGRDEAMLSASPRLAEYLTSAITVTQAGQLCPTTVPKIVDFVHTGARVVATCPAEVEQVDLRITMLHDVNKAYRTVAIGIRTDPAQSVFTATTPMLTWRFGAEPSSDRPWLLSVVIVVALVLGGVAAAVVVLSRRRHSA